MDPQKPVVLPHFPAGTRCRGRSTASDMARPHATLTFPAVPHPRRQDAYTWGAGDGHPRAGRVEARAVEAQHVRPPSTESPPLAPPCFVCHLSPSFDHQNNVFGYVSRYIPTLLIPGLLFIFDGGRVFHRLNWKMVQVVRSSAINRRGPGLVIARW